MEGILLNRAMMAARIRRKVKYRTDSRWWSALRCSLRGEMRQQPGRSRT